MPRRSFVIFLITACANACLAGDTSARKLIRDWAPLVWLAPGERFLPLGVPEFLSNVQADESYLRTRVNVEHLLRNESSFLYGMEPADRVPVYAFVRNCNERETRLTRRSLSIDRPGDLVVQANSLTGKDATLEFGPKRTSEQDGKDETSKKRKKEERKNRFRKLHFHVTYWMFYPFSEGKSVCVLNLGFFGTWPIPTVAGRCFGRLKEYGNHVGDWEHVSLYFKGKSYPLAMYVSAHDAGAYYIYEPKSSTFVYASQETRKGIFQKPTFPERVYTAEGSHPVLFSARGSHGLWTAPGKHRFVRLPRLYDESGFGTAWPTWRKLELLSGRDTSELPAWMNFRGKWGNPKSNCHPLAQLGIDICEFVDGPTGIPMKQFNFRC